MKKKKKINNNTNYKNGDYDDELYQEKYQSFYNNLNDYMINYVIPSTIAFYLASSYEYNCLGNHYLKNHLNSALELFNVNVKIEKIKPLIQNELLTKYHLKIVKEKPLIIEKSL